MSVGHTSTLKTHARRCLPESVVVSEGRGRDWTTRSSRPSTYSAVPVARRPSSSFDSAQRIRYNTLNSSHRETVCACFETVVYKKTVWAVHGHTVTRAHSHTPPLTSRECSRVNVSHARKSQHVCAYICITPASIDLSPGCKLKQDASRPRNPSVPVRARSEQRRAWATPWRC